MRKFVIFTVFVLTASVVLGDLAGYWEFDEATGSSVSDSSGNNNSGTLTSQDGSNYSQWITGYNGTGAALKFNASTTSGSNSNCVVIDIDTSDDAANLGEAFTISMWVRRDDVVTGVAWPKLIYTDAYDIELASDPGADSGSIDSHDYFWSDMNSNWQLDLDAENSVQKTLGSWYHLAVTYDGNYLRKYVNGDLIKIIGAPTSFSLTATKDLYIASLDDGSSYFTGAIDDVALWSDGYLTTSEVVKLAGESETPLTVSDSAAEAPMPSDYFTKETEICWTTSGWKLLWSRSFEWDISVSSGNTADAWWFDSTLLPGLRSSCWDMNKWFLKDLNSADYTHPIKDINEYGIEWIDPSWSGVEPNTAKFAAYITPGIALCQNSHGYQEFVSSTHGWLNKDYFKTYARVAAVNANGAQMCVRSYRYADGLEVGDLNSTTLEYLGEVLLPLYYEDSYKWQEFKFGYPKPKDSSAPNVWTEISIVNGNPDTVLYIDEFNPISDQANTAWHTTTYYTGDYDEDSIVYRKDLKSLTGSWLDSADVDMPRDSGMLANGDFYEDDHLLDPLDENAWLGIAPTGWTFTGDTDTGIQRVSSRGVMNAGSSTVTTPLGGSVAAYTTDSEVNDVNGVLEQVTSETVVDGQTYYAMAYVMTSGWGGWKDTATLSLEIDGTEVANFSRPLSIERWRPVYGTYTTASADNGKPVKVKISYTNSHTDDMNEPGYMFIGYVYLDDTMPDAWPEQRDNLIVNGGFEDLTMLDQIDPNLGDSIRNSDNWGSWFVDGTPAPTDWLFEVPSGFSEADQGGYWAQGMYGTPLPSPGTDDVVAYGSDEIVYGQVIGSLQAGTTYYLDMACGLFNNEYTDTVNWPDPAPSIHLELWRIPAGVTDGTTIYNGIDANQSGYEKIAEAYSDASGNIGGGGETTGTPASRWQLIGTDYTAVSTDTNVYVRVYGTGSAVGTTQPDFGFSDVYLSTEKRLVPGGDITFEISGAMQYLTDGPYSCSHAGVMGLAPEFDTNDDCSVDIVDFAVLADNWVENWFIDIAGFE